MKRRVFSLFLTIAIAFTSVDLSVSAAGLEPVEIAVEEAVDDVNYDDVVRESTENVIETEEQDQSVDNTSEEVDNLSTEEVGVELKDVIDFSNVKFEDAPYAVSIEGSIVQHAYTTDSEDAFISIYLEQINESDEVINFSWIHTFTGTGDIQHEVNATYYLSEAAVRVRMSAYYKEQYYVESVPANNPVAVKDFTLTPCEIDGNFKVETGYVLSNLAELDLSISDYNVTEYSLNYDVLLNKVGDSDPNNQIKNTGNSIWFYKGDIVTNSIVIENLEPSTKYAGNIRFYISDYNGLKGEYYEREVRTCSITEFETKEASTKTVDLTKIIKDEQLRKIVLGQMSDADPTAVTEEQLAGVTSISHYQYENGRIKDLTGIEELFNLKEIYLPNNDIQDITNVDWSKLTRLKTINFANNDIERIADFTKCPKLERVSLEYNCIPESEVSDAASKFAPYTEYSLYGQRKEAIEVIAEQNYYTVNGKTPFIIIVSGAKDGYTYQVFIDETDVSKNLEESYYGNGKRVFYTKNSGLSEGNHKVVVKVYDGETERASKEAGFNVVANSSSVMAKDAYASSKDQYLPFKILSFEADSSSNAVEAVYLEDSKGKVFGNCSEVYTNSGGCDLRYQYIPNYEEYLGYCITTINGGFASRYTRTPAGVYNIRVKYFDDSKADLVLENAYTVYESGETVIREVFTSGYDNSGDYLYFVLYGQDINPEKLNFRLEKDGTEKKTSYVECKYTYNRCVVKLKKEGWKDLTQGSFALTITPKDDVIMHPSEYKTSIYFDIDGGVYFADYNPVTNYFEVGVSGVDYSQGEEATAKFYEVYGDGERVKIGYLKGSFHDQMLYFKAYNEYGDVFIPENGRQYYFLLDGFNQPEDDSYSPYGSNIHVYYNENISEYAGAVAGNANEYVYTYWVNRKIKNTDKLNAIFYSDIPTTNKANLTATLYNDKGTDTGIKVNVSTKARDDCKGAYSKYKQITCTTDQALAAGKYSLELYYDSGSFAGSTNISVLGNKFILSSMSASWRSFEESFEISLETDFNREEDKYIIKVYDFDKKEVQGLTYKVIDRYDYGSSGSQIVYYVSGINPSNAENQYYIYVEHEKYGKAYKEDGITEYFADNKGTCIELYDSSVSWLVNGNRTFGVCAAYKDLPGDLYFYNVTDTTQPIKSVHITDDIVREDYSQFDWVYEFPESLIDSIKENPLLPFDSKDELYDIVFVNSDGRIDAYESTNIGYSDYNAPVVNLWDISLSRNPLVIGGGEGENTSVLTVSATGTNAFVNSKTVFSTSDPNVATVKADPNDPKKAIITAVAPGKAVISVKFGSETKTINVYVERKVTLEGIALSDTEIELDTNQQDGRSVFATLVPMDANVRGSFSFTSSNPNVVKVEKEEDSYSNAKLIPTGAGTAVVTATFTTEDEKTFTAECKVTVKKSYSDEEFETVMRNLYESPRYILAPAIGAKLSTCKLPEGWTWNAPDTVVKANNSFPEQFFYATYISDSYNPVTVLVPVNVSAVNKVTIEAEKSILGSLSTEYKANVVFSGYIPCDEEEFDAFYSQLMYSWNLDKAELFTAVGATNEYTLNVNSTAVERDVDQTVSLTVEFGGKTYTAKAVTKILAKPYVDGISVTDKTAGYGENDKVVKHDFDEEGISVDFADVSNTANNIMLSAETLVFGESAENQSVKWASADSSIASVKVNSAGDAVITVKKAGSTTISVTANDAGKFKKEFILAVKDYRPAIVNSNVNVIYYGEKGTDLGLYAQNGNTVAGVTVDEDNKDKFTVNEEAGKYLITATDELENYARTTNVTLNVETAKGTYKVPIKVGINKATPKVRFKQAAAANTFFKNASTTVTVTAATAIESITDNRIDTETGFHITGFDKATGVITVAATGLNSDNVADFKKADKGYNVIPVSIKFTGYKPVTTEIIIKNSSSPVSLKFDDTTIYHNRYAAGEAASEAATKLYDSKAKKYVELDDTYSFVPSEAASNNGTTVRVNKEDGERKLYAYASRNGNYAIYVKNTNWTSDVKANCKISHIDAQSLVLEKNTVVLNTGSSVANSTLSLSVGFKGNEDKMNSITVNPQDANAAKLINSGYLFLAQNSADRKIYLGLNSNLGGKYDDFVKDGTYKFKVTATDKYNLSTKPLTLTVKIVTKDVKASLSAKGAIDLTKLDKERRNTSYIRYTPKIANADATVNWAEVTGDNAALFYASSNDDGTFDLKVNGNSMSSAVTYKVGLKLHLSNGMTVDTSVNVKPKSTAPKYTLSFSKVNLAKSNIGEAKSVELESNFAYSHVDGFSVVESKTSKYFDCDFNYDTKEITVSLKESAKALKPGTYKHTFEIYTAGQGYNVKPSKVTLTTVVK